MSELSDLLQRLNRERWSSRRIEREAAKHGHQLSNATAAKYLRGDHPDRPNSDTLQALADVFGVDPNRLRAAAGLPGQGSPFDLGPDAARLTGPQREAIRTTVRLFVEQNDALADRPVSDGATTLPDSWTLAAMAGHSEMERLDAEADARGEENQDPGGEEPA